MKKVLLSFIAIIITTIITTIGFTALLVAFNTQNGPLYIFIPAMIIGWVILLPVYMHWYGLFKRIFKIEEDAN